MSVNLCFEGSELKNNPNQLTNCKFALAGPGCFPSRLSHGSTAFCSSQSLSGCLLCPHTSPTCTWAWTGGVSWTPEEPGAGPAAGAVGFLGLSRLQVLNLDRRSLNDSMTENYLEPLTSFKRLWQQDKQTTTVAVLCKHDQADVFTSKAQQHRENM